MKYVLLCFRAVLLRLMSVQVTWDVVNGKIPTEWLEWGEGLRFCIDNKSSGCQESL